MARGIKIPFFGRWLTGTLQSGNTTLTLTSPYIHDKSVFDIYPSPRDAIPSSVTSTTGSITMMFNSQPTDIKVRVRCL